MGVLLPTDRYIDADRYIGWACARALLPTDRYIYADRYIGWACAGARGRPAVPQLHRGPRLPRQGE